MHEKQRSQIPNKKSGLILTNNLDDTYIQGF